MQISCDNPLSRVEQRFALTGFVSMPLLWWFAAMFKHREFLEQRVVYYTIGWILVWAFLIADFLFNVIIGSIIFIELPREILFTSRLKRKKREGSVDEQAIARRICATLNLFDPGHC